jgi:hypothetical protein
MQGRRVVGAQRGGNAALRIPGIALGRPGLGQDEDAAGGEADCCAQSCDAAANDDEIDLRQNLVLPVNVILEFTESA